MIGTENDSNRFSAPVLPHEKIKPKGVRAPCQTFSFLLPLS